MPQTATFTVSLTAAQTVPVTVQWATVPGTATSPADFISNSGTLTFSPGQVSKPVTVEVVDNVPGEPTESFTVVITGVSLPSNGSILDGTGLCTIPGDGTDPGVLTDGPLIRNGLITNSYHSEYGRGGYFYPTSGTSEGQGVFIYASYLAFEALDGGSVSEQAAADFYKGLAEQMLDALGDQSTIGPLLRQAIPDDPEVITLMHWLFAARGPVPLQAIVYNFHTIKASNKLTIPALNHAEDTYRIWQIYPSTSELLYTSPYSPAFDSTTPAGETQVLVADTDWAHVGDTVELTIPGSAPGGVTDWYVLYGYNNAGTLLQGLAYEAYPSWTELADGYAACAPDTFRWFEQALTKAIAHDARSGNAAKWTKLRAALRRTAVKAQNLSDLREVFKQYPGFDAIPVEGTQPSGMFCYSDHPSATPPPVTPGLNPAWIGYNFWSRSVDGDILGSVPTSGGVQQVQIGRGFNDEWRQSASYQDPDQYIYISCCCTKKPGVGEHFYVFLSSTKTYSGATRWYADIGAYASFVAVDQADLNDGSGIIEFLIPRTDFLRKDTDSTVLPAGTRFENYGISAEMSGAYDIRLRKMRPVSGVSTAWVLANFSLAIKGSQLPFFPGAMPFAINADTVKQQFIGYNGSPFHGYQLPDFWMDLATDATAVHGSLTSADLPIPNASTGAIEHPMSPTDADSDTKPAHALLMEQQVRFLKAAQDRYVTDGGDSGPFSHTFVLNTQARRNIGNPTPHTWVYVNDDPNTRWIGYQVRAVEALAMSVLRSKDVTGFADVYTMARTLVVNWLTWLDTAWPDLTGTPFRGMPTDYDDPALGPPQTLYEEPHGPMMVARACLHLKQADATQATLCDTLMERCWDYLESLFVTDAVEMQYTWSPLPDTNTWYGFWHGEIITTLALFIANEADVAAGIDMATVRLRLVQTKGWLAGTGVVND